MVPGLSLTPGLTQFQLKVLSTANAHPVETTIDTDKDLETGYHKCFWT